MVIVNVYFRFYCGLSIKKNIKILKRDNMIKIDECINFVYIDFKIMYYIIFLKF